jgi:hypothetical protein
MLHHLNGKMAAGLGGFRIEVSVKAVSLAEAVRKVRNTPFLDPGYYLGLGQGPASPILLSAGPVTSNDDGTDQM